MDKKQIEDVKKKLLEINTLISSLNPEIRAAAFDVLAPFYFSQDREPELVELPIKGKKGVVKTEHPADSGAFFAAFTHDKPSDNVHLITAWLYSQYGIFPITRKEIGDFSADVGLTIPDRPDRTMAAAVSEKKKLYKKQGSGWQLTVHGESYMKQTYNVKKGSKPRPTEDNK